MKAKVFGTFIILASLAAHAQTEMTLAQAEQNLRETYTHFILAVSDAEMSGRLDQKEADQILTRAARSQQTWTQFRKADCALSGAKSLGMSGERSAIKDCMISKTIERDDQLKRLKVSILSGE